MQGRALKQVKSKEKKEKSESARGETRSAPLWIACRTLLTGHGDEFFSRWKKAAESFQEDDVHDLRVASRRLREGLALFSPCLSAKKAARMVKQVKKVTRMLGELRNTDEAFLFFSSLAPEETAGSGPEIEQLLAALKAEREQAHKKLKKELSALDPKPLRKEFRSLENLDLFGDSAVDPFTSILFYAGGAIMERAEPLGGLLARAVHETDGAAQHQLRIAVKKMRYRLEIMEPLLTRDYEELHGALKGYQDVLGKLHDIDVFTGMVQERLQDGPGRQELLRVMADRRSRLHGDFLEKLETFPLETIGEKARDAL